MAPILSVIKIVKYCGVWGGGVGIEGRQNPTKDNDAPSLSVIKIVKYCDVGGGGGRHWWRGGGGGGRGCQNHKKNKIMGPTLSVSKIVKYCGLKYIAYKQYNRILPVTN